MLLSEELDGVLSEARIDKRVWAAALDMEGRDFSHDHLVQRIGAHNVIDQADILIAMERLVRQKKLKKTGPKTYQVR